MTKDAAPRGCSKRIRFAITTADGRHYVGPVQGSGGYLGAGTEHLADEKRRELALERLLRNRDLAEAGQPLRIHEPSEGHVTMCVQLPLKGSTIELVEDRGLVVTSDACAAEGASPEAHARRG